MIQFDIPEVKLTKEEAVKILLEQTYCKNQYYLEQLEESQSGKEYEDEWDKPDPEYALEERDRVYDLLFTLAPEYKDSDKLAEAFSEIDDAEDEF